MSSNSYSVAGVLVKFASVKLEINLTHKAKLALYMLSLNLIGCSVTSQVSLNIFVTLLIKCFIFEK